MTRKRLPEAIEIGRLYWQEEKSLGDIGQMYGVTRSAVDSAMRKHGIPRRDKSTARLLALGVGKFPNMERHEFRRDLFNEWTVESAYMLGVIYADGHIGRNGTLGFGFGAKSLGLVHTIMGIMGSEKVWEQDNHGFPSWQLRYTSVGMTENINLMGVPYGKKARILEYPPRIPPELGRHFIRGEWEGDGSIGDLIRFHTSSPKFAEGIRDALVCLGIDEEYGKIHITPARHNRMPAGKVSLTTESYTLLYAARHIREAIYHLFYNNVPSGLYWQERKENFEKTLC